jgi:hypothetical protein
VTIANTGRGALAVGAVSLSGPNASSFRIDTLPATTVAAGRTTSFRVTCAAVSAGALVAQMEVASDDPDENPYRVNLVATATRASGDDHGNSRADATRILVPSSVRGNIQSGTDLDFFTFTLTAPTTVTIRTTGLVDTYGTLFTATGSVVTRADDSSDTNLNFSMTRTLIAGTYFVAVEGYDTTDVGAYTVVTSR